MPDSVDNQLRTELFAYVDRLVSLHGEVLSAAVLRQPFRNEHFAFKLLQATGIFKPAGLGPNGAALILLSSHANPYKDSGDADTGFFTYKYQGGKGDEDNHFNRSLRAAMQNRKPLLFLQGVDAGSYLPIYPSYIISDNRADRSVHVVQGTRTFLADPSQPMKIQNAVRAYQTRLAKQRLHQQQFRSTVLRAYRTSCAMCNLKIPRLLEAAHIIPDNMEGGDPVVVNGMSLCRIHHTAYDVNIVGVTPDYQIKVSEKTLAEIDGPMLQYGLQSMHGRTLSVPRLTTERPDPERLDVRYRQFLDGR
jgi:putative restriction endonuclease